MSDQPKGPAKARVRDLDAYGKAVAVEVRGHMAALGALGWSLWDIAEAVGCSRTALVSWRNGANDMPARKLLKLRDVVVANPGKRRTGT